MGRTYDASIQELLRYGLGLGYFDKFDTVEGALCNVYASVKQLKDASLLLHAPETDASHYISTPACERFSIHDVVCDVVRSIASKDRHVFTVINGHVPRSLTNEKTLKNCTSITLYNIDELSKDLESECPNIKFLCVKPKHLDLTISDNFYVKPKHLDLIIPVKPKHLDLTIPDNFFIGMWSLQVLHLIEIDLRPLPSSLSYLVNLQALCLDHCKLGDVVAIGDMNKLEVLSFRGSYIQMLPKELCQLTKLRLLDLTDCSNLSVISSKVMSSLTGIEALYMNNTSIEWKDARPSIDELKHLRRLTTLEIHFPESKMFRGLISSEPKRYNISIGDVTYRWRVRKPYSNISRRFLRLKLDTKEDWIISQLPGVEELELKGDVVGAMNLLDDLDRNGFPQLMYLRVSANDHCVCIVNSVSCAVLPSLESLMVKDMESLEKICNSPLGADSFLNLKTIRVEKCNKLSNIFCFFSIVRVLSNLTDLKVFDCENMEEIFAIEEQDDGNSTGVVHDIKFSHLSCLRLTKLPKLKSFCCKAKTASPLQLASDTSASEIFSAKELNNHSSLFNEKVKVPNLEEIKIFDMEGLTKLTRLCYGYSVEFPSLKVFEIQSCPQLKEFIFDETVKVPKLEEVRVFDMEGLTKLTRLCSGYSVEFPSLKVFEIQSCPQLKKFIFDETVKVLNLEELRIFHMDNLEMIWYNKLTEDSFSNVNEERIRFSNLKILELRVAYNLTSFCSCKFTLEFPSLEELEVWNCRNMKTFSGGDLITPKLRKFTIDVEHFRLCPDTTLNTFIQQFHDKTNHYARQRKINQGSSSSQHME